MLRVQLPAAFKCFAFNCLRRSNASRSKACGVQMLRVQKPAAFKCFAFKSLRRSNASRSIACGVQLFRVQLPAAFNYLLRLFDQMTDGLRF
jgi:hypothetical protein